MKLNKILFLIILSPLIFSSERHISTSWCSDVGGDSQFRTKDGTYVDCLTDQFAIEVEFDYNWKESKGLCWARSLIQKLHNGEEYTLQLDSHHRFVENWDEELINMMKQKMTLQVQN